MACVTGRCDKISTPEGIFTVTPSLASAVTSLRAPH